MAPTAIVLTPSLTDNSGFVESATPQGVPPTPRAEVRDDGTIQTVDELVRRRAIAHHDRVVVSYPSSGIDYVDYTMQQLDVFAYRVAMGYSKIIPTRTSSTEKPSVVAILGPSDLDYLVTMLALIKLGHTVLFLSTRISPAAIESLISVTGASALLAGPAHLEVARATQQKLEGLTIDEIAPRSTYEFPVEVHADTRLDQVLDSSIEAGNFVYIIHSSGSTGLPKPIYQTHKAALANYAVSMEMKAFITLPLYHNHGICNLFRAIYSGKPIHLYNASLPLTHDYLASIMKRHKFEIFYGVPYALKLLAESDEGIDILRSLKIVMYGGSACPDDLGNRLVDCDVNLIGHYGATEVGQLMTSFRPRGDKAWNYVRESEKLAPYLEWIPRGPNLFECAVRDGWPAKIASNQPDGSYRTKDLFEPHPTIPKAWKYIARSDDTIVLVNGEKFNPVQVEGDVRSDRAVAEAVVFGSGRPYLGILVIPAANLEHLTADEVREVVWPVVQRAQKSAESYARISKEMICILPADCPCPRTDKGSVIRSAFYKAFAAEIEATYDAVDAGSGETSAMSEPELRKFLREALSQVTGRGLSDSKKEEEREEIGDDTDFFLLGLDSLQALQLRSQILRSVDLCGKTIGQNVVFDFPSIDKLCAHLLGLAGGQETKKTVVEDEMRQLIDELGNFQGEPTQTSVVVTGATGSLGAHVVACLLRDPSIHTIYCLVRAADDNEASRRLKESLLQRRLFHTIPASSAKRIVALRSSLSNQTLGLDADTYKTVTESLGAVIHCAWSVNFNMHISSFKQTNLAGVLNLIELTRAGQNATFNFCSSVSATSRCPLPEIPERVAELEWAQGMGYAQSKSVAEHLCARAAQRAGVRTRVLRVGQIIADTKHGVWNHTEAIPLMLQTAITVGALPRLRETPSWLPVDDVAQAVADISLSDAGSVVANVTNPKSFRWTEDLLPALRTAGLEFDEVEPKEWVRRLRESDQDPEANPPIKLVEFFASKYDRDEFPPSKMFATDVARRLSPALADAPVLSKDLVAKFVAYFRSSAWATNKKPTTASDGEDTPRTVVVMAGPCGSGKSSVGGAVSEWLGVPFIEGDSLHRKDAITRMASRTPLTDEDRVAWLKRVARHAAETVTEMDYPTVVLSCSALKRAYRDVFRQEISRNCNGAEVRTLFFDLQARPEILAERMRQRQGHYMSPEMVPSQVALHEPADVEEVDVLPVNCEGAMESVVDEVKWLLGYVH